MNTFFICSWVFPQVSEIYSKELKGAISALASLQGHLLIAAGPKIILHKWTGTELNGVAFFDPPLHVVSLNIVCNGFWHWLLLTLLFFIFTLHDGDVIYWKGCCKNGSSKLQPVTSDGVCNVHTTCFGSYMLWNRKIFKICWDNGAYSVMNLEYILKFANLFIMLMSE